MHWMTGIPPQVIQAKSAPKPADPRAYVLRVGQWQGHSLGELLAWGQADYLRSLVARPTTAVSDEVKGYIRAVLSEAGGAE